MDKRRLKIISRALEEVQSNFPDTMQFIEDCIQQGYLKENMSVDEVKKLAQKNISYSLVPNFKAKRFSLHLTKYAKRYSMKLNSLSHDVYLRVI